MKKKFFPAAGAAVLIMAVLLATACASLGSVFQEPEQSMESFEISGISFDAIDLLFKVRVHNPNAYPIPMPVMDWALDIAKEPFVSGEVDAGGNIGARADTIIELPVRVGYKELYNGILALFSESEVAYDIALGFRFPFPIIESKRYEVDFGGVIPLLKLPEISFGGVKVTNVGLTSLDMVLNVGVLNKNAFSLFLNSFDYDFRINNAQWSKGSVAENGLEMPAGTGSTIPLEVKVNSLAIVREVLGLISGQANVDYSLSGAFEFGSGLPILKDFELPFSLEGATRISR